MPKLYKFCLKCANYKKARLKHQIQYHNVVINQSKQITLVIVAFFYTRDY